MLPNQAPVVIIGWGITGVSTLYHLAKRGVPAVLLERKRLASGTTWHAAGIVGNCAIAVHKLSWPSTQRACSKTWKSRQGRRRATNKTER